MEVLFCNQILTYLPLHHLQGEGTIVWKGVIDEVWAEVLVGVLQSCCVACDLEALSPAASKSNQLFSCLLQQHKKLRGLSALQQ
jgi:hypothetical protein